MLLITNHYVFTNNFLKMFELGLWPANFIASEVAGQRPCSNVIY